MIENILQMNSEGTNMVGAKIERPTDVTILAILVILVGYSNFLILMFQSLYAIVSAWGGFWVISFDLLRRIMGLIPLVLGWGLWYRKQWAYKGTLIIIIYLIVDPFVSVLIDPTMIIGHMRFGERLGLVILPYYLILGVIIINGIILYYLLRPPIRDAFDISLPTGVPFLTALECFGGFYSILFTYYIYHAPLDIRITEYYLSFVIVGLCSLVVGFSLWTHQIGAYESAMIISIIGFLTALFQLGYLFPLLISQVIVIYYLIKPEIKDIFGISDKTVRKLINGALFLVILGLSFAFVDGSWNGIYMWILIPAFINIICMLGGPRICFPGWLGLGATIVLMIFYSKDKWTAVTLLQVYVLSIMMSLFYISNLYYVMQTSTLIMFLFILLAIYLKILILRRN